MSLIRSSVVVACMTMLSRLSGFARDIMITSMMGTGPLADAFNIAFRLPNFFRRIFAEGAFSSAFIPIYARKISNEQDEQTGVFLAHVLTMLSCAVTLFVILLEFFLPYIMYILAPGFVGQEHIDKFTLSIELSRITLPYLIFISLVSLIGGILNTKGKFTAFSASPILLNIVLMISLTVNDEFFPTKAHALSWGVFVAGIVQFAAMYYSLRAAKVRIRFSFPAITSDIRALCKNMVPSIFSAGLSQINILVDQIVASFIPGAISVLVYAERINLLPLTLIGTTLGTVVLPLLSRQIKENNIKAADKTKNKSVYIALLLSIPACVALIILAPDIIRILFERGEFKHSDTIKTADTLIAFTISLPALVVSKVFSSIYFANQDTKTPLQVSIKCIFANIGLSIMLMWPLEHVGIALSASISAWLNVILLFSELKKKKYFQLESQLKDNFYKIIAASCTMGVGLSMARYSLDSYLCCTELLVRLSSFILLILIGMIIFTISGSLLGVLQVKRLVGKKFN